MPSRSPRLLSLAALLSTTLAACPDDTEVPFGVDAVDGSDGLTALGDVLVASAADLAKLDGVRHIDGDLTITMTTAVSLPDLESVGGALRLVGTQADEVTPDLSLPALEEVGDDLEVAFTKDSGTLDLPALREIRGSLVLTHGTWKVQLGALERVAGDLRINDAALAKVELDALKSVGSSIRVLRFGVAAGSKVTLTLPALTSVAGDIELAQGADLAFAAPALTIIGRDLDVAGLRASLDLRGLATLSDDLLFDDVTIDALDLRALATVQGDLAMNGARGDGLVDLELASLATVVGDLDLRGVANLTTASFPALVDLGGTFALTQVPSLATVTLAKLPKTYGPLVVSQAGNVAVVASSLAEVGGDLRLEDCGRMQGSFPALTKVIGTVAVRGGTLVGVSLPKLAEVGRDLVIEDLSVESDELHIDAVTTIGGTLRVAGTLFLDAFHAVALTHVGSIQGGFATGDLVVRQNFALATLDVPLLAGVERDLVIRDNPRLTATDITTLVDNLVVGGATTVCGNDGDGACPAE